MDINFQDLISFRLMVIFALLSILSFFITRPLLKARAIRTFGTVYTVCFIILIAEVVANPFVVLGVAIFGLCLSWFEYRYRKVCNACGSVQYLGSVRDINTDKEICRKCGSDSKENFI